MRMASHCWLCCNANGDYFAGNLNFSLFLWFLWFMLSQAKCLLEDQLYAHERDCTRFYICNGGYLVDLTCSYGLSFSLVHGRCVTRDLASCYNQPYPEQGPVAPSPSHCQHDNALFAHPNCDMFYICSGGFLVEQTCSWGTRFSAPHGKCVSQQEAFCFS